MYNKWANGYKCEFSDEEMEYLLDSCWQCVFWVPESDKLVINKKRWGVIWH